MLLGTRVAVELLARLVQDHHVVGDLLLNHDVARGRGLEAEELLLVVAVVGQHLVDLVVLRVFLEDVEAFAARVQLRAVVVHRELLKRICFSQYYL